jgi:hypothetical protein
MIKKRLFSIFCVFLLVSCSPWREELEPPKGKSGPITRFVVWDKYMYALDLGTVKTFDLTDKKKPVLVSSLETDYGLETITIYDNIVYLGSATALYVLDITTNPAVPSIAPKTDRALVSIAECNPVIYKDNYAFSTVKFQKDSPCGYRSDWNELIVYDITDKSAPRVINRISLSLPNGLGIKDDYVIVCDEGKDILAIFDIKNIVDISNTTPTRFTPSYTVSIKDPIDLIVRGNRMVVSSRTEFQVFDVSDIANIRKIGQVFK